MTDRLVKGAHLFVQGQLTTREYDRTVKVPAGEAKTVEHTIPQLAVELKPDITEYSIFNRGIGHSNSRWR